MNTPRLTSFTGGAIGEWRVIGQTCIVGAPLPDAARLAVGSGEAAAGAVWTLRGTTSNHRYTEAREVTALVAAQEGLGRGEARQAALIPITKSAAWWALAQDERRALFEVQSRHIAIGMEYLPAVARRLHHGRDLGEAFDFLTWFEYAPRDAGAFDEMLDRLRATPEWRYVEREVDIRLIRA